jgi:hypothetical protein
MLCQGKYSRAWHAREAENAVAYLWGKVGVGTNDTANDNFHPIGPEQDISRYQRGVQVTLSTPRGTSYPVIDTVER